ncbi:DUF4115 domain-containing protein [bacterium]|nr:DUF4115 domain-containing protein [bacterium]
MTEHIPMDAETQQVEQMKKDSAIEIGDQLKNQRKSLGISLVEVAEHTKIGKRYLESLEEGQFDEIPCETYILGFLRAYAKYLELDDEKLARVYKNICDEDQDETCQENESKQERSNNQPVWIPLLSLLILAGVGAGLFLLWPSTTPEEEQDHTAMMADTIPEGVAGLERGRIPGPDEPMTLKIKSKDKTWITMMADGRQEPDVTLAAGEERTWQAQDRFVLWTGNAGGIEVTFNGELQPSLGKEGEVCKEVVFERPEPLSEPEIVYE